MGIDDFISPPPPFFTAEQWNNPIYQRKVREFFDRVARQMNLLKFLPPDGTIATNSKPVNFDAVWVVYTSNGSADTQDKVAHALGRIPGDILVGMPDKSAVIYKGTTAWDSSECYLKASAATVVVNILLF